MKMPKTKKIFISVGHGGKDCGAVGNDLRESDMTLKLSKVIGELLGINGFDYMLSRTSDIDNVQATKIEQIKKYKPDLMLDIHFNAFNGKASGVETYYQNKSENSKNIAAKISAAVAEYLSLLNRGAKNRVLPPDGRDYFGMLRNCPYTAVLLETCFIDNATDMKGFLNAEAETLKGVAASIVKSVCSFYGVTYEEKASDEPPKTESEFNIGDEVIISGKLYLTANATSTKSSVSSKRTQITRIAKGTKHPYNTTGDRGWMDATDIKLVLAAAETPAKPVEDTVTMTVNVASLALHNNNKRWIGKGKNSTVIAWMSKGETVTYFPGTETKLGQYTSVKVKYKNLIGYCAKNYLK